MALYTPTTTTSATMTASTSPAISEAELDRALRQGYQRKLAIPAIVVEEQPLLHHLSLIHDSQTWADLDETQQQQLANRCRRLMHGRGWTWQEQLDVKGCPALCLLAGNDGGPGDPAGGPDAEVCRPVSGAGNG